MADEEEEKEEKPEIQTIFETGLKALFTVVGVVSLVLFLITKSAIFEWTMAIGLLGYAVFMVLDAKE